MMKARYLLPLLAACTCTDSVRVDEARKLKLPSPTQAIASATAAASLEEEPLAERDITLGEAEGDWEDRSGVTMVRISPAVDDSDLKWTLEVFDGVDSWSCGVKADQTALCRMVSDMRANSVRADVKTSSVGDMLVLRVDKVATAELRRTRNE